MSHRTLPTARRISATTQIFIFSISFSLAVCSANAQDFNRDVRPILAAHCFACHGPDASHREADLRFDERDNAIESSAIVPGDPSNSGLIDRVMSDDREHVMPPPEFGNQLSPAQVEILNNWIATGANFERHWAFVAPLPTNTPKLDSKFVANPIDEFVLDKLRVAQLSPNPAAGRYALIRTSESIC